MSTRKLRVGVVGTGRGGVLANDCKLLKTAVLVAICDNNAEYLTKFKEEFKDQDISYYDNFDEFIKYDMDCVVLANYAHEHAKFAIKAMENGKDVISEVLPCKNLAEAVALIDCQERTGRNYFYSENYCYMKAPYEMKRKYKSGELGEFEYGEGEYLHDCESLWPSITQGNPEHWRNCMSAFFYCTHSAGPLLHITGLRPVKVMGFENNFNEKMARMGARAGGSAVEIVTLENGAHFKSLHGVGPSRDSVWYSVYGSKGRMESAREGTSRGNYNSVFACLDGATNAEDYYTPIIDDEENAMQTGHGGGDYYALKFAFNYLLGDKTADVIDLYEAIDMWLIGHFGYFSCVEQRVLDIPNFRDKAVREQYRYDTRSCFAEEENKEPLVSYLKSEISIDPKIYDIIKEKFNKKD